MITYDFTEQGIEQALTALGTTPNAVATNLSAMGFRGCRDAESNCPVANYLLDAVPHMGTVGVYAERVLTAVALDPDQRAATGHAECALAAVDPLIAELPRPVAQFVIAFDLGDYPDLITEAVR